ncbi:MAG: thioredoxin [Paludibacteraceae bacterium]|jgi:thioredoxin|nr:thioredoxin [Paludibacteraceae bacterium]
MKKIIVLTMLLAVVFLSCKKEEKEIKQTIITPKIEKKMGTIQLNKETFLAKVMNYETNPSEWKYLGDKPCIIDFYADWCGPCKAVAPVLEDLAKEYDGKIYIYKVNTDEQQELAQVFGIQSIPTIYFCPMEGEPQMAMGALPKATIKQAIAEVLKVQ